MTLISWLRFQWNLTTSELAGEIPAPFQIRSATAEEETFVHQVVNSSFSIDGSWADAWKSLKLNIEQGITDCFEQKAGDCLVITHGTRIIGTSVLDPDPSAENNLLTGPCILHEYRSRGLGSLLLRESLKRLKEKGLEKAYGLTRERTMAARFVYRKFAGVSAPYESGPELAARLTI
ncbi:MAG: GNAT family N-acetyltransferase [Chthoniobacterales bacterium]